MCLAVTKFVLRKINFGVWFIQTFLQKMHQIWQKKQNAAKENESNPAEEKMRSCGEGDIKRRRGRCDRSTIAIAPLVDRRAVRLRRARSSIAPLNRRSHRAISSIAIVDCAARSTIASRDLVDRDRRSRHSIDYCTARSHQSQSSIGAVRSSDERPDLGSLFSLSFRK